MGILDNLIASKAAPAAPPSSPFDVSPPAGMNPEDVRARLELNFQRSAMGVPDGHLLAQLHNEGWAINKGTPDFTNIDNQTPGKPILSSLIEAKKKTDAEMRASAPELAGTGMVPLTGNELAAIPPAAVATVGELAQGIARFIPEGIAKAGSVVKNLAGEAAGAVHPSLKFGGVEQIAPEAQAIEQFGRIPISEKLLKTPEEKTMATGISMPLQLPGQMGDAMGEEAIKAGLPPSVAAAASIVPDAAALALFPGIRKSFKNVVGAPIKAGVEAAASKIAGKIPPDWLYTETQTTKGWTRDQIWDHLSGKADIDGTVDPALKESLMKMTPEQWKDLIRLPKESSSWTPEQLNDWLTNSYGIEIARIVTRDPTWLGKIFGIKAETITETSVDWHGRPNPRRGTGPETPPPGPEAPPEPPKAGPTPPPPNEWEAKFEKDSQKTYKSEAAAERKAQGYAENGIRAKVAKQPDGTFRIVREDPQALRESPTTVNQPPREAPGGPPVPPPPAEPPPVPPEPPPQPAAPAPPPPEPATAGKYRVEASKIGKDAGYAVIDEAGKAVSFHTTVADANRRIEKLSKTPQDRSKSKPRTPAPPPEAPAQPVPLAAELAGHFEKAGMAPDAAKTSGSYIADLANAGDMESIQRVYNGWNLPIRAGLEAWWGRKPEMNSTGYISTLVSEKMGGRPAPQEGGPPASKAGPEPVPASPPPAGPPAKIERQRERPQRSGYPESQVPDLETAKTDIEAVKSHLEEMRTDYQKKKATAPQSMDTLALGDRIRTYETSLNQLRTRQEQLQKAPPAEKPAVAPEVAKTNYQAEADAIGATPPIKHVGEMGGRQMYQQAAPGVGSFTQKPGETVAQAHEAAKVRYEKPAVAPEVAKTVAPPVAEKVRKGKAPKTEEEIIQDLVKKAKGRTSEAEIRKTRKFMQGLNDDGTPKVMLPGITIGPSPAGGVGVFRDGYPVVYFHGEDAQAKAEAKAAELREAPKTSPPKEPPKVKPSQHSVLGQLKGRIKISKEDWNANRIFENGLAPFFTTKPSGMQYDKKIQELMSLGILPEGSDLDTLIERLQVEQKARREGKPVGPPSDAQTEAAGQEFLRKEEEKYDLQPVSTWNLSAGDTFKIRDEEYKVIREEENGNLVIQDGEELTLAADSEVYINGGEGGITKSEPAGDMRAHDVKPKEYTVDMGDPKPGHGPSKWYVYADDTEIAGPFFNKEMATRWKNDQIMNTPEFKKASEKAGKMPEGMKMEIPGTPSARLAKSIEDLMDEKLAKAGIARADTPLLPGMKPDFKLAAEEAPVAERVRAGAAEQPLLGGTEKAYRDVGMTEKPGAVDTEEGTLERASEILPQALVNLLADAGLDEFTDDWLHDRVEGWVSEGKENPEDGNLPEWVTPVSRKIVDIMKTRGYVAAIRKAALAGTYYKITRKGEDAILKLTEEKKIGGDSTLYSGFPIFDREVWKKAFPNGLDDIIKDLQERRKLAKGAIRDDLGWFNRTVNTPYYVFVDKHPEGRPVFDRARRAFQEREDITADLSEMIEPYARLSQADQKPVNKTLIRGRYRRKVFTNEELRGQHHLTDAGIEAYRGVRKAMEHALSLFEDAIVYRLTNGQIPNASDLSMDMLADLLDQLYTPPDTAVSQGDLFGPSERLTNDKIKFILETIDKIRSAKRMGYVPFSRFGDFAFGMKKVVNGQPGEYTYWSTAESGWKAAGEFKKMKDRFAPGIAAGRAVAVPPHEMAKNAKRDLINGVGAFEVGVILQMAGLDVGTNAAFKDLIDKLIQEQGFKSHFLQSNDLPGFSTDIERALADYVIGISGYIARMKAVPEMDKAALPAFKAKPKLAKYYEDWKSYIFSPQEEFHRLRSALFVYYLGGNIKSAMVNLTQPFVATMPWLTQYVSEVRAAKEMARAYADVTKAIGTKEEGGFGIDVDKLPGDVREQVRRAIHEGIISETLVYELMATARKPPMLRKMSKHKQRASYYLGMLFSRAEKMNRMVSMIAALRVHDVARQKRTAAGTAGAGGGGMAPPPPPGGGGPPFEDDPYEFGKRSVDETQFLYSKLNRPKIFRGWGAALGVFRTFALNFIEMLARTWRVSRRAVMNHLAMLTAFAGVLGLPFASDVKNLVEGIYQMFSHKVPDIETAMRDWSKEVLGSAKWIDVLLHGPARNTGADISRSVGQGDVVPGLGGKGNLLTEIIGVPADIVTRVNRAYASAMAGDYGRAGESVAPEFIRNPMVAARWAKEGVLNTGGQPIVSKDRLNALDILLKTIGVQPTKVSIAYEREDARDRLRKRLDQAERDLTRQILLQYRKGNDAEAGRLLLTADGIQTGQSTGNGEPEIIPIPHGKIKKPEDMVIVSLPAIARMRQEQMVGDKMTGILKQPYLNRPAFLKLNDLYQ